MMIDRNARRQNRQSKLSGSISPVRHLVAQFAASFDSEIAVVVQDHSGSSHGYGSAPPQDFGANIATQIIATSKATMRIPAAIHIFFSPEKESGDRLLSNPRRLLRRQRNGLHGTSREHANTGERNHLSTLSSRFYGLVRDYVASTSARALGRSSQKSKTHSGPPESSHAGISPVFHGFNPYSHRDCAHQFGILRRLWWTRAESNRRLSEKPPSIDVRNFRDGFPRLHQQRCVQGLAAQYRHPINLS